MAYNDVKESLTEILNLEFSDLMGGKLDSGYPQHKEMRQKIRSLWSDKKSIFLMVQELIS